MRTIMFFFSVIIVQSVDHRLSQSNRDSARNVLIIIDSPRTVFWNIWEVIDDIRRRYVDVNLLKKLVVLHKFYFLSNTTTKNPMTINLRRK